MPNTDITIGVEESYQAFQRRQAAYATACLKKWQGFLKGEEFELEPVKLPQNRWPFLAMMLEAQQIECRKQRGRITAAMPGLVEDTLSADLVMPEPMTLAIVRDTFPRLIVWDIMSVQPMGWDSGGKSTIFYWKGYYDDGVPTSMKPTDVDYAVSAEATTPAPIKFKLTSADVTATKNALRATWSSEAALRLKGRLGLDLEGELVNEMSAEIARELNGTILTQLETDAGAGNVNWLWTPAAGYTAKEWYQTLGDAVIDASNLIYTNLYREASWVIAGTALAGYFAKMSEFQPVPNLQEETIDVGFRLIGTINGGLVKVYKTSLIDQYHGIVGCNPRGLLNADAVWAPWIPLTLSPLVYAGVDVDGHWTNTDEWTRNVTTWGAYKTVETLAFAKMHIAAS